MNGKLKFGCDYLYIMVQYIARGDNKIYNSVCYTAARMFLLDWGFTIEETDQVNEIFWEKVEKNSLGELVDAVKRVVAYASKEKAMQERLVIQLAAIGELDKKITDDENKFIHFFQNEFDFKPSEFSALAQKGIETAIALVIFGEEYKDLAAAN